MVRFVNILGTDRRCTAGHIGHGNAHAKLLFHFSSQSAADQICRTARAKGNDHGDVTGGEVHSLLLAVCGGIFCVVVLAATGDKAERHHEGKYNAENSFHFFLLCSFVFY